MNGESTVGILDELLSIEQSSLAVRLMDATVFVSGVSVDASNLLQRLAVGANENVARLSSLIVDLGGTPGPRRVHVGLGEPHFLDVQSMFPQLAADQEAMIRSYERAAEHLAAEPSAAALAGGILERHREELAALSANGGAAALADA